MSVKAAAIWFRDKLVSALEEEPGIMSSTRIIAFILTALAAVVVVVIVKYVLRGTPDASVVTSLAEVLTALVLNGAVAIIRRGPYVGPDRGRE